MRPNISDAKLLNLFLDMLAAEQGAGDNTLDAYRRDLTDLSEFLARSGHSFARAETQALRDYLADVDRLLAHAKALIDEAEATAPQRLRAIRLYCLLEVLYATGLRVSELMALPRSAARRDARMIVVRGKGDKERLVPLNETSRQAMADYLAATEALKPDSKKHASSSKWLFP